VLNTSAIADVITPFAAEYSAKLGVVSSHAAIRKAISARRHAHGYRVTTGLARIRRRANTRRPRSTTREGPLPRAFSSFQ
jgi:hypothetical protein